MWRAPREDKGTSEEFTDAMLETEISKAQKFIDEMSQLGDLGDEMAATEAQRKRDLDALRAERRSRKSGHHQLRDIRAKLDKKESAVAKAEALGPGLEQRVKEAEQAEKDSGKFKVGGGTPGWTDKRVLGKTHDNSI